MKFLSGVFARSAVGVASIFLLSTSVFATVHDVAIRNFTYSPHGLHITVGDSIRWTNNDAFLHTSTSDNGDWNSGNLSQGQSYTFGFSSTGSFPYHCAVHLSMKDTIFVSSPTSIDESTPGNPSDFELSQNYPNPFNARTVIGYSLNHAGHVRVEIFDILGNTVETLFDEDMTAGPHEITWNAGDRASGVFFYRVNVDGYNKTGRMTLLK
jgi:plastocyanin